MGVSKNSGTPKWMVKIMETPIKMDDLGGKPTIFGNTHIQNGTKFSGMCFKGFVAVHLCLVLFHQSWGSGHVLVAVLYTKTQLPSYAPGTGPEIFGALQDIINMLSSFTSLQIQQTSQERIL